MKERLIWRPNSVSPEEWAGLSRDEQIRWWKDRQPPPGPPPHPLRAVDWHTRGITNNLPAEVFPLLTPDTVGEFLAGCPADLLARVRAAAGECPADGDEAGWGRVVTLTGATYAPWVTAEEIEQSRREQQGRFRDGVRVFRAADRG